MQPAITYRLIKKEKHTGARLGRLRLRTARFEHRFSCR